MIDQDATAVPVPGWWYSILRDKEALKLPDGEFELFQVEGKEKSLLLVKKLAAAVAALERGITQDDDDVIYPAAAVIIETMSFAMASIGKDFNVLDQEIEDQDEEFGSYHMGWYAKPSEEAQNRRLAQIK